MGEEGGLIVATSPRYDVIKIQRKKDELKNCGLRGEEGVECGEKGWICGTCNTARKISGKCVSPIQWAAAVEPSKEGWHGRRPIAPAKGGSTTQYVDIRKGQLIMEEIPEWAETHELDGRGKHRRAKVIGDEE